MRLFQSLALGVALAALTCASLPVHADTDPALESNRLNRPSDTIGTIGSGLFGDSVDLYSGSASFNATDISIPGNSRLPVSLGRHLDVKEADQYGGLPGFANWEIDVPYLTGYFSEAGWTATAGGGFDGSTPTTNRCSLDGGTASAIPPSITKFFSASIYGRNYWSGNQMYVPGAGTQEMLVNNSTSPHPTDGKTYYWVTKNLWTFSCLPTLPSGGAGEGFLATSPDGTRYYFDRMMYATAANTDISLPYTDSKGGTVYTTFQRYKYWIVASHIVDRFGNTVTYNYDANDQLNSIAANDGRSIQLTYGANGNIASASNGSHTWTYQYGTNGLSAVVQPDGSSWSYQYSGDLVLVDTTPRDPNNDTPPFPVSCNGPPIPAGRHAGAGYFTLTATHPSGATGLFQFQPLIRGRSYDTHPCTGPDPMYPKVSEQFALFSKSLSGPGVPVLAWTYTYSPPNDSWSDSVCTPSPCPSTVWTKVHNPDGTELLSTFGNKFQVTEGQLQETTLYKDSTDTTVLNDATTTYWGYTIGQPFPQNIGTSPQFRANIFQSQTLHPVVTHNDVRDGVTFSSQVNAFDAYAAPVSTTSFSSLGSSRTDLTTYDNNTNLWVLGQVKSVQNSNSGVTVFTKTYYPATALLQNVYSYGLFEQSYTFGTDGNIATVTDGNNHVLTLSNYYRGVPRLLQFPNSTSKTALVDNEGHVTAITDEIGNAVGFAYDPMGRLATITQPSADTVAWAPTTITFAPVAISEYGLSAGHWKQTVSTGNARKVTYFDGFWQPVLTQEYDAASPSTTTRFSSKTFDFAGRATFGSYPVAAISAYNSVVPGAHNYFDGLGRPTSSVQDSELGPLTTSYAYLTGFQTRVTNPRNYSTTTSYQVFGSPDTSHPTLIQSPEGVTTTITRDVFGKPLTLTR